MPNLIKIRRTNATRSSAFIVDMFRFAETLGDMENDYGVLPVFKFDKNQTHYYSGVQDSFSTIGVPSNTNRTELTGAFLEAMGYYSYYNITPAYFESALKIRYSRNSADFEMYMIATGKNYNFGTVVSYAINNPLWLWRNTIEAKNDTLSTLYNARVQGYESALKLLIDQYINMAKK